VPNAESEILQYPGKLACNKLLLWFSFTVIRDCQLYCSDGSCSWVADVRLLARLFYVAYYTVLSVFSCKKGELFDYLTQVVTLSEKRTRFVVSCVLLLLFPLSHVLELLCMVRKCSSSDWWCVNWKQNWTTQSFGAHRQEWEEENDNGKLYKAVQ